MLAEPGGTEVNVRDWASGSAARPSPCRIRAGLGKGRQMLREHSIPVVDDLAHLSEAPDIIHGSHTPTIIESIVRFPATCRRCSCASRSAIR